MFSRTIALVLLIAGAGPGASAQSGSGRPDSGSAQLPVNDAAVIHTLNRLTYGPRPGDVERVREMGLQRWIETQLTPAGAGNPALDRRLAGLETLTLDAATIHREYHEPAIRERRQRQLAAPGGTPDSESPGPESRSLSEAQRKSRQVLAELQEAKLLRAVYSERQLEEVLVDFWFNHFNVFAGKGAARTYIGEYEREAIRPHVLGRFRDMLGATAKSPAMLFYLDNWLSTAPQEVQHARGPRARPQARGLNENYARELLELHTLGVDAGYTQDDIVNVARAFTGWTLRPRRGSGFLFVPALHDRGEKRVLGHVIPPGGGVADGERVLDILAAHPATAKHIATRLAIRFVGDTPPASLVERVAARFAATRGDLREVVRTLVTSPEFFAAEARHAKVKTPFEFVASALRATNADVRHAQPLARTLREMGMPPYFCQPPTGYDDASTTWVNAGALVSRMNFALELARNQVRGVRVPLSEQQALALEIGAPAFQRQ